MGINMAAAMLAQSPGTVTFSRPAAWMHQENELAAMTLVYTEELTTPAASSGGCTLNRVKLPEGVLLTRDSKYSQMPGAEAVWRTEVGTGGKGGEEKHDRGRHWRRREEVEGT